MTLTKSKIRAVLRETVTKKNVLRESKWTRMADTDEQEVAITHVVGWLKKLGVPLVGGEPMPEASYPRTVLLDLTYNGGEIYIDTDGTVNVHGDPCNDFMSFSTAVKMLNLKPRSSNRDTDNDPGMY